MFLEGKNTVNISPCPEIAVEPIPPANVIKVELFVLNEVVDEPVLNEKPLAPVPITEEVNCNWAPLADADNIDDTLSFISFAKFAEDDAAFAPVAKKNT